MTAGHLARKTTRHSSFHRGTAATMMAAPMMAGVERTMTLRFPGRSLFTSREVLLLLTVTLGLAAGVAVAADKPAPAVNAPAKAAVKDAPKSAQPAAAATKETPKPREIVPVFEQVRAKAEMLAEKPFAEYDNPLPPFLSDLDYDQYRDVRFRPDHSLWLAQKLPFQVQFFSRGSIFRDRVQVHVVEQGVPTMVQFDPGMFDFGRLPVPMEVPKNLGFAGFRVHHPLNVHHYFDEVVAFLGASYFRAVARGEVYGLSARGLALDTGLPKGEEFPVFREFWLVKPGPDAKHITVFALLDSKSVAGAYRFVITPGEATQIDVTAHLHFRNDIEKLGVAPLTSMFYHGKTTQHFVDDFRPEIHDSEGLLIAAGNGEQIWRPLKNPQRLAFSYFQVENPRGFGLVQRERHFGRYLDLEAKYQRRPSAWVTPVGIWGKGTVELVEIPTEGEVDDNIAAFWVPAKPIKAGSSHTFEYTLEFADDPGLDSLLGRVVHTGIGPGKDRESGQRLFVIDFAGGELGLLPDSMLLTADVSSSVGALGPAVVERNPFFDGYRVFFQFSPGDEELAELRCVLRAGDSAVSETWTFQWAKEKR
jgi:glucans biosynthesis protein